MNLSAQLSPRCATPTAMHFLLIAAATWLIHHDVLERWWCYDDTQILKHAVLYSPLQYFFVPEAWRELNNASLTPWLTLTYDIDLALFGFEPRWFYAHNLFVIGGCAWLIFLLIQRWGGTGWGLAGAVLFLVGSPVATAAQQLMTRQYVEGLFFYLLALWLVLHGLARTRRHCGTLAAASFAVAASAKEVFLPLGLVPFLLPLGTWRQRFFVAWPILIVMALYVPWRWYMLGDMVGGYTPYQAFSASDLTTALLGFSVVPQVLWFHPHIAIAACGSLILFASWRYGRHFPFFAWRILALIALLSLPLFPLIKSAGLAQERFYVAAWAAFSLVASLTASTLPNGLPRIKNAAVLISGILLVLTIALSAWKASRATVKTGEMYHAAYRAHGTALVTPEDSTILYASPDISPWYLSGMIDLRSAMQISAPRPSIVFNESQLANSPPGKRRVLRYSPSARAMTDITSHLPSLLAHWRERLRPADLSIRLEYAPRAQTLHWHGAGQGVGNVMTAISPEGAYPLPLSGSFRVSKTPFSSCIRFLFEVDGGIAYTPELAMPGSPDADGVHRLAWTGRSDMFDGSSTSRCQSISTP